MPKIILIDVDDCLKIQRVKDGQTFYGINKNLIDQLKQKGDKNIFIFTNMDLSDMDKILLSTSALNYITRHDLVEFLKNEGFVVHGVITPADVTYQKGLGAVYRDFYEPAYQSCIVNPEQYQQDKRKDGSYNKKFIELVNQLAQDSHYDSELPRAPRQKRCMFAYFEKEKPANFSEIEYYDDDESCLSVVNVMNSNVKTHVVTDKNNLQTPLLILHHTEFEKIVTHVGNSKESDVQFALLPGRLVFNDLHDLVVIELAYLNTLYSHITSFQEKINLAIREMSIEKKISNNIVKVNNFNEFQQHLPDDPAAARRQIVTLISSLIANLNQDLYKKITKKPMNPNEIGFSSSHTDKCIFDYFPDLLNAMLPIESDILNKIACNIFRELEQKAKAIKIANMNIKQNIETIKSTINNNQPKHILKIWKNPDEKTMSSGYCDVIAKMIGLIRECDKFNEHEKSLTMHKPSTT